MADIDCSVCQKEIVGSVAILHDDEDVVDWSDRGLATYRGENEDGKLTEWVMLHLNCFNDLLQEIYKSERMVAFNLMITTVPVAREALGM